jgi:hypothetical protein
VRDMAGAFRAGGSAALIAAFTAIPGRRRRRFCTRRAGAARRMARGNYFASRCKAAPSSGRRRKIVEPRHCKPAPGRPFCRPASGRSPLGKAASAAPFFRQGTPPPRPKTRLSFPARYRVRALKRLTAADREYVVRPKIACGRRARAGRPDARAGRRRRGGTGRG